MTDMEIKTKADHEVNNQSTSKKEKKCTKSNVEKKSTYSCFKLPSGIDCGNILMFIMISFMAIASMFAYTSYTDKQSNETMNRELNFQYLLKKLSQYDQGGEVEMNNGDGKQQTPEKSQPIIILSSKKDSSSSRDISTEVNDEKPDEEPESKSISLEKTEDLTPIDSPADNFVEILTQTIEKCATEFGTICNESKFCKSDTGSEKYCNCAKSALAVYIHTTKPCKNINSCCKETAATIIDGRTTEYAEEISDFVNQIDGIDVGHMCMVAMELSKVTPDEVHIFTLELRHKTTKGFYLYSSWANLFSLKWFLGLEENMRSEMPIEKQKSNSKDSDVENLREKCGLKKFIKFEELETCVKHFLSIFKNKEEIELEFSFNCGPLNRQFKALNHY